MSCASSKRFAQRADEPALHDGRDHADEAEDEPRLERGHPEAVLGEEAEGLIEHREREDQHEVHEHRERDAGARERLARGCRG